MDVAGKVPIAMRKPEDLAFALMLAAIVLSFVGVVMAFAGE